MYTCAEPLHSKQKVLITLLLWDTDKPRLSYLHCFSDSFKWGTKFGSSNISQNAKSTRNHVYVRTCVCACVRAGGTVHLMSRPKYINTVRFATNLKIETKIFSEKFITNQTHSKPYLRSLYIYIQTSLHTDNSVGIADRNGLDRPGIETRWRRDRPWCPPSLLHNGYWAIPGGKAAEAWR